MEGDGNGVREIQFTYNGVTKLVRFKVDLSTYTLDKVRRVLTQQVGGGLQQDAAAWRFTVNDVEVAPLDAPQRHTQPNTRVELEYLRDDGPVKKARRAQPAAPAAEKRAYSVTAKLKSMMRENVRVFQSECDGNGVHVSYVYHVLNHLRMKALDVDTPVDMSRVFIEQSARGCPLRVLDEVGYDVALAPYFTPGHVALTCVYGGARVIHLDASATLNTANTLLMQELRRTQRAHSLTCINYQAYDDAAVDVNLAGGNCASFAGIQAVRAILLANLYSDTTHTFAHFMERFARVLERTPLEKAKRVLAETLERLVYHFERGGDTPGQRHFAVLPLMLFKLVDDRNTLLQLVTSYLQDSYATRLGAYDFTADVMMLDMFNDAALGFHEVARLGNVLRVFLHDMMQRGLIALPVAFIGVEATERARATVALLAAWLLTRELVKLTEDELERLVDAFLDIPKYGNLDSDVIERVYEAHPRKMADIVLRNYMGIKESDTRTPQVLALTYLQQRKEERDARAEREAQARRQQEVDALTRAALALPIPGDVAYDEATAAYGLRYNEAARGKHVFVPQPLFDAVGLERVIVELRSVASGKRTFCRIERASDTNRIEASMAVLEALDRAPIVKFIAYADVQEPSLVEFVYHGTTAPGELEELLEAHLVGWPALSVGETLTLSPTDTVHVRALHVNDAPVQMVAMPFDDRVNYTVEPEKAPAATAAIECAMCSGPATFACGAACGVRYCGAPCQAVDWERHARTECIHE